MAMHGLSGNLIRRRKSRTDEQNQTFAPENRGMDLFWAMPNHSVLAPSLYLSLDPITDSRISWKRLGKFLGNYKEFPVLGCSAVFLSCDRPSFSKSVYVFS